MGKLTDIPEVEFVIKIFLIMYLTVRLSRMPTAICVCVSYDT